jgi:TPR repeat protein
MKRTALGIILLCFGFAGPASAEFRDGLQAYYRLDYKTALNEWQALAEQGDAGAQYQLGVMHYRGEGVIQNYDEAAKWFRAAAENGDADAQFTLGLMYSHGQGVEQDYVQAHLWFSLAAWRYANSEGRAWAIEDTYWAARNRNWALAKLSPAQIAEARRLVQEWKAKQEDLSG